jgi:UPF0716 protein FxsA
MRILAGLWLLAELAGYVLVASWIGVGWTILATLVTSALGWALLARQLKDPTAPQRWQARVGPLQWGRLGDLGLAAVGGLLMILPGFVGDLVGLLCLLPGTRALPRLVLGRALASRLPDRMRGPVRVTSERTGEVPPSWPTEHPVIEGEVADRRPA